MGAKIHVDGNRRTFRCPGCNEIHQVDANWSWNGSFDRPTFHPSIQVRYFNGDKVRSVCHFFVAEGRIAFQNDCTHNFKSQTVELPDWDRA